jgi:hypothetical protein
MFFRNRGFMIFGNQGLAKLQIRKHANFGDLGSEKTRSYEHTEAQNLGLAVARTSKGG